MEQTYKNFDIDIRDHHAEHDVITVQAFDEEHAMQEAKSHVQMFGGSLYNSSKARPGCPIMSAAQRAEIISDWKNRL